MEGLAAPLAELLKLGFPGVVIIGLALAVWRLFKLYNEVNEKRIAEAREGIKAIEANTTALDALTSAIRDRRPIG